MISAEFLSRIQFAFTIAFHILFPAFSIGLATFLAIMEGAWLKTKNPHYLSICRFWMKVFALTFGMGVVSGIVMEFQLGTNWSGFTHAVGPVLGSLFTWEVLTAFFIEAGFLGVMIFGWDKVGPKLHYCATLLVFFGVTLSAFWILAANSWMQTPSGAVLRHGQFVVTSWWHVIFNPSVIVRYFHMLLAAYLTTVCVIAAVSAYYILRQQHQAFAQTCFSFATLVMVVLIPIQIAVGDTAGLIDFKYQPIKTAAMEANWHTQPGAPMVVFAWPNMKTEQNQFAITIPHLASLINTHQWNGVLPGLTSVPRQDRPDVPMVFFSFRIMVAMGLLMLLLGCLALYFRARHKLYTPCWLHRCFVFAAPAGFIAIITGWFTAEIGRQPYVVYNLLRTTDAASHISWHDVVVSLVMIFVVYGVIFGYFYFRYLAKIIRKGPEAIDSVKMPFAYLHAEGA